MRSTIMLVIYYMHVSSSSRGRVILHMYYIFAKVPLTQAKLMWTQNSVREILKHHLTKRMYQIVNE